MVRIHRTDGLIQAGAGEQQVVAMRTDGTNERVLYRGDVMLACCLPEKP
jgi:hypothetical protein